MADGAVEYFDGQNGPYDRKDCNYCETPHRQAFDYLYGNRTNKEGWDNKHKEYTHTTLKCSTMKE